jgi:hypothetical protein
MFDLQRPTLTRSRPLVRPLGLPVHVAASRLAPFNIQRPIRMQEWDFLLLARERL